MDNHGVPRTAKRERTAQEKLKEEEQIKQYSGLVAQAQERYRQKDYSADALTLTSTLLSHNPEFYTIWNYRRRILQDVFSKELADPESTRDSETSTTDTSSTAMTRAQKEISLLLKEDLQFLMPLQRINPKVYWMWNHRTWLLNQASEHLPIPVASQFWREELALVSKMLSRDDRNFHGWTYRRTVAAALEELRYEALKVTDPSRQDADLRSEASMSKEEFAYADKMVRANLSNFSAWHHRMLQLRKVLDITSADSQARRKAFDEEIVLATEGVATDPADQSLWFHFNDLMATLEPGALSAVQIVKDFTTQEKTDYVDTQIETVKEIMEDNEDSKWVYQSLLQLSQLRTRLGGKANDDERKVWLNHLDTLDPLRAARWQDLRKNLGLQ